MAQLSRYQSTFHEGVNKRAAEVDKKHKENNGIITQPYLLFLVLVTADAILAVANVVDAIWPDADTCAAEEEFPDVQELYSAFAKDILPPLREYQADFSALGSHAHAPGLGLVVGTNVSSANDDLNYDGTDCVSVWRDRLLAQLAAGGYNASTSPLLVGNTLRGFGLENLTKARKALGEGLLTTPQSLLPLLEASVSCASQNRPLRAYACAALNDATIAPQFVDKDDTSRTEGIYRNLHQAIVLNRLTVSMAHDMAFAEQFFWEWKSQAVGLSHRIWNTYGRGPAGKFRYQKFWTLFHLLGLATGVRGGGGLKTRGSPNPVPVPSPSTS
jgi:hypothetical protein